MTNVTAASKSLPQPLLADQQSKAATWFKELQERIIAAFEEIEGEGTQESEVRGYFEKKPWNRADLPKSALSPPKAGSSLEGGGIMALMKGNIFEKVGVNFSEVYGSFSETFAKEIPGASKSDGQFWASGISLVAHMSNPHVPAVHMNTRMICTSKAWFGGGADLTPMFMDRHEEDGADFHLAFQECCERHPNSADYSRFKEWCDEYFFLPHRNEPRGLGGIFYDYLENTWEEDFAFTKDVGETFLAVYPKIVRRHMHRDWTKEDREYQLQRRGRYVEFNLLYDRGTRFGLQTGGNSEAVLMSMPPVAKWD